MISLYNKSGNLGYDVWGSVYGCMVTVRVVVVLVVRVRNGTWHMDYMVSQS